MFQSNEGFVVLKGSHFAIGHTRSFSNSLLRKRDSLLDKGILVDKGDHLLLQSNHTFSSPSTAAAVVLGRNANGLTKWKLKNVKSLKDIESLLNYRSQG